MGSTIMIGFNNYWKIRKIVLIYLTIIIRNLNYSAMKSLAKKALSAETSQDVETLIRKFFKKYLPDIPIDK